jgi:hypothetical protein
VIEIFVDSIIDSQYTTGSFTIKVYIVDNLKTNLLIGNNTLKSQRIIINFGIKIVKNYSILGLYYF